MDVSKDRNGSPSGSSSPRNVSSGPLDPEGEGATPSKRREPFTKGYGVTPHKT
jgi:hypothetical protein